LARPITLAFEPWACSRNDEKSDEFQRVPHGAEHLSTLGFDDVAGILLKRITESVIRGQEKPGIAALFGQSAAGANTKGMVSNDQ